MTRTFIVGPSPTKKVLRPRPASQLSRRLIDEPGAAREPSLAQLAESRLGSRFDEPELRLGQMHDPADLGGRLLFKIETDQHLPVPPRDAAQHPQREFFVLTFDCAVFRVSGVIGKVKVWILLAHGAPGLHRLFDL